MITMNILQVKEFIRYIVTNAINAINDDMKDGTSQKMDKLVVMKDISQKAFEIVKEVTDKALRKLNDCHMQTEINTQNSDRFPDNDFMQCGKDTPHQRSVSPCKPREKNVHFASPLVTYKEYSDNDDSDSTLELPDPDRCPLELDEESLHDDPRDLIRPYPLTHRSNNGFPHICVMYEDFAIKKVSSQGNKFTAEAFDLQMNCAHPKEDSENKSKKECENVMDSFATSFKAIDGEDVKYKEGDEYESSPPVYEPGVWRSSPTSSTIGEVSESTPESSLDILSADVTYQPHCTLTSEDIDNMKLEEIAYTSDDTCIAQVEQLEPSAGELSSVRDEAEMILNCILDDVCVNLDGMKMEQLSQLSSSGSGCAPVNQHEAESHQGENFDRIPLTQVQESQESYIEFVPASQVLSQQNSQEHNTGVEAAIHIIVEKEDERKIGEKHKVHIICNTDMEEIPAKKPFLSCEDSPCKENVLKRKQPKQDVTENQPKMMKFAPEELHEECPLIDEPNDVDQLVPGRCPVNESSSAIAASTGMYSLVHCASSLVCG